MRAIKGPAGALDPLAGLRMRALVRVPLISADLVHGALGQAHDVERVDRDLGVGQALADRLLIAAGHVDRDGADRALALAEQREEALQGLVVATGRAPHDRARAVIDDGGQVARPPAVGDLIHADRHEAGKAPLVEVVGHHALDDPPDRVPRDPQHAGERGLCYLLRDPGHGVLEVARVARAGPGPRHGLEAGAAVAAPQPPQLALDEAAGAAQVEMAPALDSPPVDLAAELAAARADPSPAAQPDGHDHPLAGEAEIGHPRPGQ